jgi:predicted TIM-barrel fold metal-dependent hydrolase
MARKTPAKAKKKTSGKRGIIDAHNHPDWHGHDLDRVLANMDRYGIAKAWLLSWECPQTEHSPGLLYVTPSCLTDARGDTGPIPFSRCVSYKERAPGRFVLGYAPDPRAPEAIDRMRAAIEIYGVRVCGEVKFRMMLDNPDAVRFFRFCGEQKVPVTVHLDYELNKPELDGKKRYPRPSYWYGGGIEALERAIRQCPETVFLGHAPGFWSHISGDDLFDKIAYPRTKVKKGGKVPEMLRTYPNLYCDFSAGSGCGALKRDPAFAKEFLDEFQDRFLFARDCFDNEHREFLDSLGLPKRIMDKIYFKNAQKLVPDEG